MSFKRQTAATANTQLLSGQDLIFDAGRGHTLLIEGVTLIDTT